MFISGNTTYTPSNQYVGRLEDTRESNSSLIYIYPMIFDSGIVKKWEGVLRDFQTAQFVNQIKTTNVLNILQIVTNKSVSDEQSELIKLLNRSGSSPTNSTDLYHQMMMQQMVRQERNSESALTTQEYSRRIREIQGYIRDQIQNDPKYDNLRPAFSIISLENNMVDIPLILGSKTYKVGSSAMFWMLFVGLSQNDTNGFLNIRRVIDAVSRIPEDRYFDVLHNTYTPSSNDSNPSSFYDQLKRETNQSLEKAMRTFSTVAGSLSEFESDIGFGTNISADSALFTNIATQSSAELDSSKANAKANINNEVVRAVFPLMQNLNNMIVDPNITINFSERYQTLLESINSIANTEFIELDAVISYNLSNAADVRANFDIFKRHCSAMSIDNTGKSLIDTISQLRILYRDLMGGTGTTDIVNMLEKTNRASYELKSLAYQQLQIFADILRSPSIIQRNSGNGAMSVVNKLYNAILKFYYDSSAASNIYVPNSAIISDRIIHLFGPAITSREVDQLMHNNVMAFANITNYIIVNSMIRSICEYLSVISAKINIKSRDLTRFPNYTLVIPIEYARTLYYALAARNLSQAINNIEDAQLKKFKLSETEIFRIIPAIIERLNVPNVIFVDDGANTIYYQWSFLRKPFKLNKSSIESYIKTQQSTVRAF